MGTAHYIANLPSYRHLLDPRSTTARVICVGNARTVSADRLAAACDGRQCAGRRDAWAPAVPLAFFTFCGAADTAYRARTYGTRRRDGKTRLPRCPSALRDLRSCRGSSCLLLATAGAGGSVRAQRRRQRTFAHATGRRLQPHPPACCGSAADAAWFSDDKAPRGRYGAHARRSLNGTVTLLLPHDIVTSAFMRASDATLGSRLAWRTSPLLHPDVPNFAPGLPLFSEYAEHGTLHTRDTFSTRRSVRCPQRLHAPPARHSSCGYSYALLHTTGRCFCVQRLYGPVRLRHNCVPNMVAFTHPFPRFADAVWTSCVQHGAKRALCLV